MLRLSSATHIFKIARYLQNNLAANFSDLLQRISSDRSMRTDLMTEVKPLLPILKPQQIITLIIQANKRIDQDNIYHIIGDHRKFGLYDVPGLVRVVKLLFVATGNAQAYIDSRGLALLDHMSHLVSSAKRSEITGNFIAQITDSLADFYRPQKTTQNVVVERVKTQYRKRNVSPKAPAIPTALSEDQQNTTQDTNSGRAKPMLKLVSVVSEKFATILESGILEISSHDAHRLILNFAVIGGFKKETTKAVCMLLTKSADWTEKLSVHDLVDLVDALMKMKLVSKIVIEGAIQKITQSKSNHQSGMNLFSLLASAQKTHTAVPQSESLAIYLQGCFVHLDHSDEIQFDDVLKFLRELILADVSVHSSSPSSSSAASSSSGASDRSGQLIQAALNCLTRKIATQKIDVIHVQPLLNIKSQIRMPDSGFDMSMFTLRLKEVFLNNLDGLLIEDIELINQRFRLSKQEAKRVLGAVCLKRYTHPSLGDCMSVMRQGSLKLLADEHQLSAESVMLSILT